MKQPGLLILGNGGAAIHAVSAARSAGYEGEIHQVSDKEGPAFNPMLSPYYLKGIIPWERCFPFGADFYRNHGVTCHFGSAVQRLDPVNKEAVLESGEKFHYHKCLIATGAKAMVPPVTGLQESGRAFTLRTAQDTKIFEEIIPSAKKAVVLGASLVGVKVTEILRKRGVGVIMVDVAEQILPRSAHPESAALLQDYFEKQGVDIRLGCSLKGLESDTRSVRCLFSDSTVEDRDFVAVCTGIQPSVEFLARGQVDMDQGILVDERMETSVEGLYAAGDVCQGLNLMTGKSEWLGLWGNACYQGRTAGLNMAGADAVHHGTIPQHVSPFFHWTFAQLGDVHRQGKDVRIVSGGHPERGGCHLFVFDGQVLVGVNLINRFQGVGRLKSAILRKVDFGELVIGDSSPTYDEIIEKINPMFL